MTHVGNSLKKAIEESGYAVAEVARHIGVSTSTVFRWFDVPNLPVKHILSISEKFPNINLKPIYDTIEEKQGFEIPDNPYRKKSSSQTDTDPGIKISIDTEKYAGYSIPPDLIEKVREYILEYQKKTK